MMILAGDTQEMYVILQGIHGSLVPLLAGHRCGEKCAAMVGVIAGQDMLALWTTLDIVGQLAQSQGGIHRGGTAGGKKNAIEIARGLRRYAFSQLSLHRMNNGKGRGVTQAHDLRRHRICDLLPAIAGLHTPHTSRAIQHAMALLIINIHTFATHNNRRGVVVTQGRQVRPGMQ